MASQKNINASTMTAQELLTNMTPNQVQAGIRAGQVLKQMAMDNGHTQEQVDKYENATWMKAGLIYLEKPRPPQQFVMCLEKNSIILMEHEEHHDKQPEDGIAFWGVANDEKLQSKGGEMLVIKEQEKQLREHLEMFQNYKKEDVLYNNNAVDKWCLLTIKELIDELKRMNANPNTDNLRLLDCNIRNVKHQGKKYYRVTFTSPNIQSPSRVEAVFGHFISGFTYIIKEKVFKDNKDKILECVEYEKTEFGKGTRWDIAGNVYKKDKKDKKKKKK